MGKNTTLDQIDKALNDWKAKLSAASDNLLELDDLFTYKRLRGDLDAPPAPLTGITQQKVGPALDAVRRLWECLQQLNDVMARAANLRQALPRFWSSESMVSEIKRLLEGPSITLPEVKIPLAERGLLASASNQVAITPTKMLEAMQEVFDAAKGIILEVDRAWQRLEPGLADAELEATSLQSLADSLGESGLSELVAIRQRLTALHTTVMTDPLGVNADFEREITPPLKRVRPLLEELSRQRDQVKRDLDRAHTLLDDLDAAHTESEQALEDCRAKIENPVGLLAPLAQTALHDLRDWLTTLETTYQQGRWRSARVGLERWTQTAQGYLANERKALAASRAPVEARAELRGRLASLRVKAQAYTARGLPLDPTLETLASEADQLLQRRPTPLDRATALVSEYEARLRSLTSKG